MGNMTWKYIFVIVLFCFVSASECFDSQNGIEERGKKKKKIALLIFFADLVLKKIFILKLVYAFVFWVVIHKAGYFLTWFVSYLKEKKSEHHDHHEHHGHYIPQYEYGPPGPYRKESHGIY